MASLYSPPNSAPAFEIGDTATETVLSAGDIQSMSDYFVPRTKTALVRWLSRYYPADRPKFQRKKKEVLYAIYYSVLGNIRRGIYPGGKS